MTRSARGIHWYFKQLSGEAKWDDYLEQCRLHGHEPMSRRDFERQRADAAEGAAQSRCC